MKRLLLIVLGLTACQQSAVSPSAALQGLRDMVQVGTYVFATSTEQDELRVLNVVSGDATYPRKYVRAPNPIQALSIPVLKRPTTLVTDLYYGIDGGPAPDSEGPYVYASSPGTAEISIVWAEDLSTQPSRCLTELARLSTIAPVTAMAAQGAPAASVATGSDGGVIVREQPDQLFFATFDGTAASLFRLKMLTPEAIGGRNLQPDVKTVVTLPGVSIIDMIALGDNRLAVATRSARDKTGSAEIVDGMTGARLVTLQFPSPVRALYTHGEYNDPFLGWRPPAARIYGVLDEDACGSLACGGIVAVEADTGERVLSAAGRALPTTVPLEQRIAMPLNFGAGLVQSVDLQPQGKIALPPDGINTVETPFPVLGLVSLSNGELGVFAAAEMQHIYNEDAGPSAIITLPDSGTYTSFDDAGSGPSIALSRGAARTENIIVVGNGIIPGLGALPTSGGTSIAVSAGIDRVKQGDLVDGCLGVLGDFDAGFATVMTVGANSIDVAPPCIAGTVAVRAAGDDPYVVVGEASGYIGRSRPARDIVWPETYFSQYPGYDPRVPAVRVHLPAEPVLGLEERFTFSVTDGHAPFEFLLTTVGCTVGSTTYPGTVMVDQPQSGSRDSFYIAYPSANAIMEITPSYARRTALLDTGLYCWR